MYQISDGFFRTQVILEDICNNVMRNEEISVIALAKDNGRY